MTTSTSQYDDLVRTAVKRATIEPDPSTHMERRESGWRRFNVMLPSDEHRAFKIAALEMGIDMSDIARSLIAEWVTVRRAR